MSRLLTDRESQRAHNVSARYGTGAALTVGTTVPDDTIGKEGDLYHKADTNGVIIEEHQKQSGTYVKLGDINAAFTSYTSTITANNGLAFTSVASSGKYRYVGNSFIYVKINVVITVNGPAASAVIATLPFNVGNSFFFPLYGFVDTSGGALSHKALTGEFGAPGSNQAIIYLYDGTYPGDDATTLTVGGYYVL